MAQGEIPGFRSHQNNQKQFDSTRGMLSFRTVTSFSSKRKQPTLQCVSFRRRHQHTVY